MSLTAFYKGGDISPSSGIDLENRVSIGAEITRQRIARAKLLLRNSDKTVAEIAKSTGFCTPSHLSNTFRDSTGETPRHYRSNNALLKT